MLTKDERDEISYLANAGSDVQSLKRHLRSCLKDLDTKDVAISGLRTTVEQYVDDDKQWKITLGLQGKQTKKLEAEIEDHEEIEGRLGESLHKAEAEIEKLTDRVAEGRLDVQKWIDRLRVAEARVAALEADVVCLKNALKPCDRHGCDLLRHPQFRFCERHSTLSGQYKGGTR